MDTRPTRPVSLGVQFQRDYIRRDAESGINLPARMRPETLARIGALAKYLLVL